MSRLRSLAVDHDVVSRVPRQTLLLTAVFLLRLTLGRSLTTTNKLRCRNKDVRLDL